MVILKSIVRRTHWAFLVILVFLGACAPSGEPVVDSAAVVTPNLAGTVAV